MDAVEFFKTVNRLCKNNQIGCKKCPIYENGRGCMVKAYYDSIKSIEETISKVEQWAKDHPVKTRQSELLKLFPNAKTDGGAIIFCPRNFLPEVEGEAYCKKHDKCRECRKDYWLAAGPYDD